MQGLDPLDQSPPPSPTKATPRLGALESETLRSSLHHAHRMIQNLKNNIHREKTEKIELRRMLQDMRDELEQRRDGLLGSGSKRQKTRSDPFKKPARPDMLGGSRRARTDIEFEDEDWEEHTVDTPSHGFVPRHLAVPTAGERLTDASDAYQTANDTEGNFETADEKQTTESEDFQTGAESLASDSTDDLTETEDTASQSKTVPRGPRPSLTFKPAGDRRSFISTASDEDDLKTPVVAQTHKFRLRNGRQSFARQRVPTDSTPTDLYSGAISQDSPATVRSDRSPPALEQSLFAELGDLDDNAGFGTPGRSSLASAASTPGVPGYTPNRQFTPQETSKTALRPATVDSATMTDTWQPEQAPAILNAAETKRVEDAPSPVVNRTWSPMPSDFPLPPTVPTSPAKLIDHSTQYTPQRNLQDSPIRNTAFITPPKTVWDEAQSPQAGQTEVSAAPTQQAPRVYHYSGLLMHDTTPASPRGLPQLIPPQQLPFAYSAIQFQATEPIQTPARSAYSSIMTSAQADDRSTPTRAADRVAGSGLLASAAAAMGFRKTRDRSAPVIAEDETSETEKTPGESSAEGYLPFRDASGNSLPTAMLASNADKPAQPSWPPITASHDQGSQTLLTAEQIEDALHQKTAVPVPVARSAQSAQETTNPLSPPTFLEGKLTSTQDPVAVVKPVPVAVTTVDAPMPSPVKRPSSALSQRAFHIAHPPLPADHREAIAKATERVASPTREVSKSTVMGPPALPASAMRRPPTSGEPMRSPIRDSNGQRMSDVGRTQRGTVTSQLSLRSSISSFASEIDERFHLHQQGPMSSQALSNDPRVLQAITQTMIGEFLWKYTRKPGRSEMSESRHRRYFWVHPYTKTLYWSDQDPQTAGRNEMKAKSVLIESVPSCAG